MADCAVRPSGFWLQYGAGRIISHNHNAILGERQPAMGDPPAGLVKKLRFYLLKLPLILVLICLGYLFDFLVQLPFALMCAATPPGRAGRPRGREAPVLPGSTVARKRAH